MSIISWDALTEGEEAERTHWYLRNSSSLEKDYTSKDKQRGMRRGEQRWRVQEDWKNWPRKVQCPRVQGGEIEEGRNNQQGWPLLEHQEERK